MKIDIVKCILLIMFTFIAAFGISGINFNGLFKNGRVLEARVLVISLSFALGYILTMFVMTFLNLA